MRVWTDGQRILHLEKGSLSLIEQGGVRSLGAADASRYSPTGALAVSPDGATAWVAGEDRKATRVGLADGSRESFGWTLVDATYESPGQLLGLRLLEKQMELVRFTDAEPEMLTPVVLPPVRPIAWPFGAAYQFAAYEPEWSRYGEARATTTEHGSAVAHVSGLLFVRWADGSEVLWQTVPIYQGWICAYVHADGVVVSAVHNGRTGEVVWLDREGLWVDGFDSQWKRMGPCVPSPRGFIGWVDEDVVRFEGHPRRIIERAHVGGMDADVSVDASLTEVAAVAGKGCFLVEDGRVRGDEDTDPFERLTDPLALEPIRFAWVDDPTLGRLPVPGPDQVATLLALADGEGAASTELQQRLAMPQPAIEKQGARNAVLRHLYRAALPPLGPSGVRDALGRLARADESPFVNHALRRALPERWRELTITEPVEPWLRAHIALVHQYNSRVEGVAGATAIATAELVADASRGPVRWCLQLETDGPLLDVWIAGMELEALTTSIPDEPHVFLAFASQPDGSSREGYLTLDLLPGGWAYGVRFDAKPSEGEPKLSFLCGAFFGGLDIDAAPDPDLAIRSLALGDLAHLHRGTRDGREVIHARQCPVEGSRPVEPPVEPWLAVPALLQRLTGEELLELQAAPSAALAASVEQAFLTHLHDFGAAAEAVENALVDADEVDELYADPETLAKALDGLLVPAR